ncbi:hypothetical protein P171DRAFT_499674 [Karstenula rhodostoma CBS 690.94]|uniref:DNA ligase D 3'-phosphoesterase domain-containing protein n=1 Tax=Karstenula rhodostoma CBS 690.94 TaxID=1392251 RepID=A0A9P4PC24_9PLEO|nr:hypothetical protein P171DRAFT_499674 [Karstenula rhodostoma CBS 690.94]
MPSTLTRDISPPPRQRKRRKEAGAVPPPMLAAVGAGRTRIEQHLEYFKERLSKVCRPVEEGVPRILTEDWTRLYQRNEHEHGNHFVVHQHNHPVSGVHYDLRLQFSGTSSMSFAVPKGLPGNPNSKSLGRMAIETRVHNLWNHLIESASPRTGSLLIWDTGTYTVLPRKNSSNKPPSPQTTDDDLDTDLEDKSSRHVEVEPENEKLIDAFKSRYIRLRLNGVRLPKNYTITLRLPSANNVSKTRPVRGKGRRISKALSAPQSTDSETEDRDKEADPVNVQDIDTDSDEDAQTRLHNAYPGSTNSIGSVHQRAWFILLDRASSGFVQDTETGKWIRSGSGSGSGRAEGDGFAPFLVLGREVERSVVTGRLAREVEGDEGVEGFVGRTGWVGITR